MKTHANIRKDIRNASKEIADLLAGEEYLESNFRKLLSRQLKYKGYDVYQEVPIVYRADGNAIPFGHGFIDIIIRRPRGVIILELKITTKNCKKQLKRYIRHWTHTTVLFGMTINFVSDNVIIEDVESFTKTIKEEPQQSLDKWVKTATISGC